MDNIYIIQTTSCFQIRQKKPTTHTHKECCISDLKLKNYFRKFLGTFCSNCHLLKETACFPGLPLQLCSLCKGISDLRRHLKGVTRCFGMSFNALLVTLNSDMCFFGIARLQCKPSGKSYFYKEVLTGISHMPIPNCLFSFLSETEHIHNDNICACMYTRYTCAQNITGQKREVLENKVKYLTRRNLQKSLIGPS